MSQQKLNSINDLPQRNSAHDIAEAAETAFRNAIDAFDLFLVQSADRHDYGTDVQIEARHGSDMTNIRSHVQLKGTKRQLNTDGSVSISVARTNLNYLLTQPDSVFVCYHLPSKKLFVCYADDVFREYEHRRTSWNSQKTVSINLVKSFDETFQQRLNAQMLAYTRSLRDRRLDIVAAPPEQISFLVDKMPPVIEVPPDPQKAREMLADLYQHRKDLLISSTFEQFAAVLDASTGAMDIAYMAEINLGINGFSFDKKRVRVGIQVLEETIKRGGFYEGSILYCIGNAWLALKKYEKAQEIYRKALLHLDAQEHRDVAAQCNKNLGSTVKQLGDEGEACVLFKRALELDPDLSEAHFALAIWHIRQSNNLDLALKHLDSVVPRKNSALKMPAVQGWRIYLLFRTENPDAAFREIITLLEVASQHNWVWPWCAKEVAQFGKKSAELATRALQFWKLYLLEHPNHHEAKREQLLCYWLLRSEGVATKIDFDGFMQGIVKLIDNGDSDPAFLWDRVGHWAQYDKEWERAEEAYRKAYELEPAQYGYCLGTALNFLGRYAEALPILISQAQTYLPDAMSWFQVAVAREGVGDITGGISAYKKAIELDNDYDLAWFNLGGLYWNSHNIAQAMEIWRKALIQFPDHDLARKLRQELPVLFDDI